MTPLTFSFDPVCPWTWTTSRWLVAVAAERELAIEWRSFSLQLLNGEGAPDEFREPMRASHGALRLVERLRTEGRHDDIGRFYGELGSRVHDDGERLTGELVREVVASCGLEREGAALDDPALDLEIRRSLDAALDSAGPDIGSPVLEVAGAHRGLHGPILGEVPPREEALAIWDAVESVIGLDVFFEIKRGRR